MTNVSRLAAALLVALGLGAMIRVSAIGLIVHAGAQGVVRLAWSARPERIETCRSRTPEELERLPLHMRQAQVCEGSTAEYQLTVHRDGALVATDRIHGAGLRRDRRLYVFKEIPVDPGESHIEIRFDRTGDDRNDVSVSAPVSDVAPRHLAFSTRVRVRPREVVLVTYSAERGELVAVTGPAGSR